MSSLLRQLRYKYAELTCAEQLTPSQVGDLVLITRGGYRAEPGTRGCVRKVRGVVVGAQGYDRRVMLLEDDPLSSFAEWSHCGDVGWWSVSALEKQGERWPAKTQIK